MKKLEKFSYFLYRDGCTLYFAVLEQPEEWRGSDGRGGTLSWEGSGGGVHSGEYPEIEGDDVYLQGAHRGKDMQISREDCAIEQAAIEKEAHVHRLLAEFVRAGGFTGRRNTPEAPSVVTTFNV